MTGGGGVGSGVGSGAGGFGGGSGSGGPGSGTGCGFGGAGVSTSSSHVGTCSTVDSCGSSAGGAFSVSCCRCAASVALKSSASGPSRMLARFRAIEHLPGQVAVQLGGFTAWVVGQHRLSLHRRLRVTDRLADQRPVHKVAEILLEDLDRLFRMQQPLVVHRRQDALDLDRRIEVL